VWARGFIKPDVDKAIAYIDWSHQEFGIAAALSHDPAMMQAYSSGDPYMEFAKMAKAVPPDATKEQYPEERERFKITALAVLYGMSEKTLAYKLGMHPVEAKNLLSLHKRIFKKFWDWLDALVYYARQHGKISTVFGWQIHVAHRTNSRTICNFPMQANGAEMLRLACCLATERGIKVCALVHDALLIEASNDEMDATVNATKLAMKEASEIVLDGFVLRTEALVIRYPDRYMDKRGKQMWDIVMRHVSPNGSGNI
jgi:DNA polymerase I-like protein with 3'-5' exonuclease and polymerase domains